MYVQPVLLERVQLADLDEELDTAEVTLGAGQVKGRAAVVIAGAHLGVRVEKPECVIRPLVNMTLKS